MARITGIKYSRDELIDIMEVIYGSVWWGTVVKVDNTDDHRAKRLTIGPPPYEGPEVGVDPEWGIWDERDDRELVLTLNDLQSAIDKIIAGRDVQVNEEIRMWIASGDLGMIDPIAADCIAQVACFGKLVFG